MKFKMKWIFVVVFLCLLANIGSAVEFEETFQYSDYVDRWDFTSGSSGLHGAGGTGTVSWISDTPSGYPYMKAIQFCTYGHGRYFSGQYYSGSGYLTYKMSTIAESTYWSFLLDYAHNTEGAGYGGTSIIFYDKNDNQLGYHAFFSGSPYTKGLYEYIYDGTGIYCYRNGVSLGSVVSTSTIPSHIAFSSSAKGDSSAHSSTTYTKIYDITTKDGIVSLGTENHNINRTFTEDPLPLACDRFTVAFHITLLKISREINHVLVIR